ncbi:AAA family ATPase [Castellaniella sp. MT123]|uniref:AAA family ATPase n=1 Tax=Castellaniella sp. MT123 TaxID=3140381 RepID=UPI0031F3F63C
MAIVSKDKEISRLYTFAAFVLDESSEEELQRTFRTDTLSDTHVARGGIDEAITWLRKHGRSPQRLLVDISGSSRPLDDLDRLADACEPSVEVYVVGDRNDVGLYRNLLTRGIQDYLVKPLSPELVRRVTEHAAPNRQRGRHGKCVTVLGTRGGVGATTVAAHLARTLAQGGTRRRVVYLDLNVHDGCGAGILGRPGGNALLDVLGNIDRLDQQYLERTLADAGNGLYVLAAELDYSEDFRPGPGVLGKLLDTLCRHFHYVVLDIPQRGGALASEALQYAAMVCLVTDTSVHSARTLTRLTRYIGSRPNPPTVMNLLNHPQPASRHRVQAQDFIKATDLSIQVRIAYDTKAPALAENLAQELSAGSEFAHGVQELANLVTGEGFNQTDQAWWRRLARKTA